VVEILSSIYGVGYPTISTVDKYVTIQAHTGDAIQTTVLPVSLIGYGSATTASHTVVGVLAPLPTVTGLQRVP
jgi:uncharacterized protein (DUF2126 family)